MWLPHFSARAGNLVPCQHPADKVQQHLTIAFSFGGISIPVEAVTPYRHKNKNAVLTQNINLSQAKTRGWVKANKKSLHHWPSKIHKIIRGHLSQFFIPYSKRLGQYTLTWFFPSHPPADRSWSLRIASEPLTTVSGKKIMKCTQNVSDKVEQFSSSTTCESRPFGYFLQCLFSLLYFHGKTQSNTWQHHSKYLLYQLGKIIQLKLANPLNISILIKNSLVEGREGKERLYWN